MVVLVSLNVDGNEVIGDDLTERVNDCELEVREQVVVDVGLEVEKLLTSQRINRSLSIVDKDLD